MNNQKTNTAYRYIPNAHTKKIYSLDWCSGTEEILLSSSRDRNIKVIYFISNILLLINNLLLFIALAFKYVESEIYGKNT